MKVFIGSLFILVSLLMALKSLIGFNHLKEYKLLFLHLSFLLGYPVLFYFTMFHIITNLSLGYSILIGIPVALLFPVWAIYGYFIDGQYEQLQLDRNVKEHIKKLNQ